MKQHKILVRNKKGFALMEVLVTVTLMATILTSIFALQGSLFRAITYKHSVLDRVFVLRNMFLDYEKIDKFREEPSSTTIIEKEVKDPKVEVTLAAQDISNDSYPFLYKLESTGKWQGMFKPFEESIFGLVFAYVPPDKEIDKSKDGKAAGMK
jgi:prepilin-type N-terminal cleavage/methylation domain-containing protein